MVIILPQKCFGWKKKKCCQNPPPPLARFSGLAQCSVRYFAPPPPQANTLAPPLIKGVTPAQLRALNLDKFQAFISNYIFRSFSLTKQAEKINTFIGLPLNIFTSL